MKKFKEIATTVGAVGTILVLLTGVSLATISTNVRNTFKLPEKFALTDSVVHHLDHDVHQLVHSNQMMWELARLMTDNIDTLVYIIAGSDGIAHEVDVRSTAEGVELAFIHDMNIVYPVRYSPADNRKYIILHDIELGENQNIYLKKR